MARYVAGIDRVKEEVGGTAIVQHHTGHENRDRERGSSVLGAAADTIISLSKKKHGVLELACKKQKDAYEFSPIRLRLLPVGESCVLVQDNPELFFANRLTENEQESLRSLQDGFLGDGAAASEWEAASGLARSSFYNARASLVERGFVTQSGKDRGGLYRISEAGVEALKVQGSTEGPREVHADGSKVHTPKPTG